MYTEGIDKYIVGVVAYSYIMFGIGTHVNCVIHTVYIGCICVYVDCVCVCMYDVCAGVCRVLQ